MTTRDLPLTCMGLQTAGTAKHESVAIAYRRHENFCCSAANNAGRADTRGTSSDKGCPHAPGSPGPFPGTAQTVIPAQAGNDDPGFREGLIAQWLRILEPRLQNLQSTAQQCCQFFRRSHQHARAGRLQFLATTKAPQHAHIAHAMVARALDVHATVTDHPALR